MRRVLIFFGIGAALLMAPTVHAAEVVGRILSLGGQPIARERVQLRELKSGKLVSEVNSDDAGNYRIDNVKPGAYVIYLRSQSGVTYVGEDGVTIDWGLAPNAPPVAVATRGLTANLRIKSPGAAASPGLDTAATAQP